MSLNIDNLANQMIEAGKGLGGDIWGKMSTYAIPELRKIAIQIGAIAEHITEMPPEAAKALFDMQINGAVAVIAAMTELTMLAIQNAINAILSAVRDFVNGAIGIALI